MSIHRRRSLNRACLDKWVCCILHYGSSLSGSNGSWIYNYLWTRCISPLTVWVWFLYRRGALNTTLCDKVCQWFAICRWFSPGIPVSSTSKTDRHNLIVSKVALNRIKINLILYYISNGINAINTFIILIFKRFNKILCLSWLYIQCHDKIHYILLFAHEHCR